VLIANWTRIFPQHIATCQEAWREEENQEHPSTHISYLFLCTIPLANGRKT